MPTGDTMHSLSPYMQVELCEVVGGETGVGEEVGIAEGSFRCPFEGVRRDEVTDIRTAVDYFDDNDITPSQSVGGS